MPGCNVTVSATFTETAATVNTRAVSNVTDLITAIGTVTYTDECEARIAAARTAYNALTEAQKALVPADILAVLTTAETTYSQLEEAAATVLVTAITLNKTETGITVGATETLSVTSVLPDDATDKTYTWSSDNEDAATVDATTGEVTAVAEGTAHIAATANDGSGVTATCTVTVSPAGPAPITLAAKLAYTGGEIADFTDATGDLTTLAWAVGEHIAILYEVEGTKKVSDAEITAVDTSTGEATITFTVEDGTPDDTPCTLVYPLSAAKDDHTGVKDAATLLAAQDGTLNANLDVRVGEGTIQTTTPGLTVTTQPEAQFAIFKFTTQDESSTAIDVNSLTVFIDTKKYVITPGSATSELYAALPAVSSQAVSFLAAGSDSKNYVFAKDGVTFAASKYYQSPLTMVPGAHLAALTGAYTAQDGETLTGTLAGNYKISIAAGATVTLNGVTIAPGTFSSSNKFAGITCNGNATITLADGSTNTVKGFYRSHPGIKAGPSGTTLTIQGTGTLYASVNRSSDCQGAGIGSSQDNGGSCGNITILGGTIYATGGTGQNTQGGPGIGNMGGNSCGNITILGGTINATGGYGSAGIGSGWSSSGSCGTITIANTVTKVTATQGSGAAIGKGTGSCGVVTIGGTIYWDGSAYQNGGDTYLTTSPFVYEP